MLDSEHEDGTIQVLLDRLTQFRLPRAIALKDRIDAGGLLEDSDIEFLKRVLEDAASAKSLIKNHPELHELSARLSSLYSDIITTAMKNEQQSKES